MDTLEDRFWDFAQDRLPYAVYDALYTFSGHAYTVFRSVNNVVTWLYKSASGTQQIETLSIQEQILPPLLSIIAIYFGLVTVYRTTASFVRTVVSIVKWFFIISLLAMGAGYFAAQGPVDTNVILRVASELFNGQNRVHATGDDPAAHPGSYGGRTQTQKGNNPKRRPSVFEPFANRQDWKDGQAQAEEAQKYVKQVVDNAQKVYKDGSTFFDLIFGRSSNGGDGKESDGRKTRSQTGEPRRARA